ncbi:MAG: hypothetical protein KU37_06760 [Sulfuricurvum sp. PC08-66]|nr:MAG: hypothetical protein KU37_06760 [Sulfuricurvum sp. PC08-66]
MTTIPLSRQAYIDATALIIDAPSIRFASQALAWWDRHYSWSSGCSALVDDAGAIVCYIFAKTDRYGDYLTIHNLFTPLISQRHGYAKILLGEVMDEAILAHTRRISFASVSDSLDFYSGLGFIYWGVTSAGDFHCDLPLVALSQIEMLIDTHTSEELMGTSHAKIYAKTHANLVSRTLSQQAQFDADVTKMGLGFRLESVEETYTSNLART